MRLGINARYVLDAIKYVNENFKGDIMVGLTREMSPVVISAVNDNSYVEVIMPISISNSEE